MILRPVHNVPVSFLKFKEILIQKLFDQDKKFLISILDPNINIGNTSGIAAFKNKWNIENSQSDIWFELLKILNIGGSGTHSRYVAPYVFSQWPERLDSNYYSAIIKDKVKLYQAADKNSRIIDILSYNIVKSSNSRNPSWSKITLWDKRIGYIEKKYIRSPNEYRVGFEKKNNQWKMVFFLTNE